MGRGEEHTGLWWGNHREDRCEDLGGPSSSEIRGMERIYLAKDRNRWRAFVNAAINFRVG
jgi:hypothetical protein